MSIEGMTIDDLLEWANGLGICTFKKMRRFDHDEVACEGADARISLCFGRFTSDGARFVSFDAFDNRDGSHSGVGAPLRTLESTASHIELYAEKLGLASMQLRLF